LIFKQKLKERIIMASLAEIRAKLVAQQTKNDKAFVSDNAIYPFWNAPDNTTSTIRFLPDGDVDNIYFWVERLVIRLPFQGIKGDTDKEVSVQVPCMEMYGETCPILAETRPWWKDPSLEALARRYWKKKSYMFNGFVVNGAVEEKETPENPIRRFVINKQIFEVIKSSLMNPEMEDLPIDYLSGRDFKLTKTKQGEFANYSSCNWSFKTRSLSPFEQDAVKTHGLFTLKDFLPKKPTPEDIEVIKDMFQASVDDQAYDPSKWANFFKPFGLNSNSDGNGGGSGQARSAVVVKLQPAAMSSFTKNFTKVEDSDEDSGSDTETTSSVSGMDVMARLQARSTPKVEDVKATPTQDPMEILRRIKEKQGIA
jgi:hypothetical protein